MQMFEITKFLLSVLGKSLINRAAQPNLNDGDKIAWVRMVPVYRFSLIFFTFLKTSNP
jgi:hypothetical protein